MKKFITSSILAAFIVLIANFNTPDFISSALTEEPDPWGFTTYESEADVRTMEEPDPWG